MNKIAYIRGFIEKLAYNANSPSVISQHPVLYSGLGGAALGALINGYRHWDDDEGLLGAIGRGALVGGGIGAGIQLIPGIRNNHPPNVNLRGMQVPPMEPKEVPTEEVGVMNQPTAPVGVPLNGIPIRSLLHMPSDLYSVDAYAVERPIAPPK
jgi:hypothetical protein